MKTPTKLLLVAFFLLISTAFISNAQQDRGGTDATLSASCNYQIALYSEFSGWQNSFVSVYVDGNLVLEDLTFTWGYGPIYWDFLV